MNKRNLVEMVRGIVREEVRYINPNRFDKEEPLKDNQTLRVFHGFNSFEDVKKVINIGLTGKRKAARIYSYEAENNPYGLFVSIDPNIVKKEFANSGVIIEFSARVSDLEAPVWVGGRSYFVQGEYAESFKNMDEREQQKLLNRQRAGESPYDYISKSDRPELAETIFENAEKQALFVGDLDPNMIKYVWYNERLHKDRMLGGSWTRMKRADFLKKVDTNYQDTRSFKYLPNENFEFDKFVKKRFKGDYNNRILQSFLKSLPKDEFELAEYGFYPKQIKQFMQLQDEGFFDKYINS